MTEYELECVGKAMLHSLEMGAPGIANCIRQAVVSATLLRLRYQFNVPPPALIVMDGDKA